MQFNILPPMELHPKSGSCPSFPRFSPRCPQDFPNVKKLNGPLGVITRTLNQNFCLIATQYHIEGILSLMKPNSSSNQFFHAHLA